ncbi:MULTISPECIES: hypothetical protein [Cellulomonas]|uniref:hypothetical protein n=1 Tax=Cellulomonas TaxID=1707 RepID=UPI00069C3AD5|nr:MULTISPECIES: hypothetical protein [Cellulomonas]MBO9567964.1 hypothetical protein [Cellulomonas iranensis]UCN13603.1 hypothetical protein LFM56_11875 [Cellulomonas iranensis]
MIARPVQVTHRVDAWCELLRALGAEVRRDAARAEALLGAGRVALRAPDDATEACGARLAFVVGDLDAAAAALAPTGARVDRLDTTTALATAGDGMTITLTSGVEHEARDAARPATPTVEPLWYTPDVPGAVAVLAALGLRRRIASTSGGWVDLEASGGGLTAAHRDALVRAELAFEHPDLDALLARVGAAGVDAALVDEAYGRSLRLPHPDDATREVFVNERQRDLYGFTRARAAPRPDAG